MHSHVPRLLSTPPPEKAYNLPPTAEAPWLPRCSIMWGHLSHVWCATEKRSTKPEEECERMSQCWHHARTMAKRRVRTQRVAALSTTDHIDVRASQLIRRGLGEQWRWGRMTRDLRALVATFEVLEEPVLGRKALAANLARVRRRRRRRARRRHTKAEQARARLISRQAHF
jgi:hypothetical protein